MKYTLHKLAVIILGMVLIATKCDAQQSKRLLLQEAIDLSLANSKQIRITELKTDVTNAKYKQQLYSSIPIVSLNSSYNHLSTNVDVFRFPVGNGNYNTVGATIHDQVLNSLSISQTIFAGLRGWNLLKSAKAQTQAAVYDVQKDKLELRNNVITAYYNHYKLLESKKVVAENIKVLNQRLKDIQNFQTVGMALKNDVLKVELSISTLEQTAAEVQSAIDINNYNLVIMTGLPETAKIEIIETGLFGAKPNFNLKSGMDNALSLRPEIKATDIRIEAQKRLVKVTRGYYSPVVSAGFNFYYSRPNQRVFLEDQIRYHDSWDIGVRLSWNLTNLFTTQFQTREANANLKQNQAIKDQVSDGIKMEVNANYSSYKLAIDKIVLTDKAVAQALENQKITKNQFDNGIKNITDMLDADNLVTSSQINQLNAKIDAEIAYAKLQKSTGN